MRPDVSIEPLGQSGFRFNFDGLVVLVDPYLSDSVEAAEGPDFARLRPSPVAPDSIADASLVLVTHEHRDHCDPDSLVPIARTSPRCRFMGPTMVLQELRRHGIEAHRLLPARESVQEVGAGVRVIATPAAHKCIERTSDGALRFVGYVIEFRDHRYYHAGDTCVHDLLLQSLRSVGPIDVAFLPVNECNFYRDRRGIIGNMSVRDAFLMAVEIGATAVVPMHHDMFEPNRVYREEIEIVYGRMRPAFRLVLDPGEL